MALVRRVDTNERQIPMRLLRMVVAHLLEDGKDIRLIQALLGHEKLETTARYTRVATGMIAKIESPLVRLSARRHRRSKRETEEPPAQ